jgi:hypothetical protein
VLDIDVTVQETRQQPVIGHVRTCGRRIKKPKIPQQRKEQRDSICPVNAKTICPTKMEVPCTERAARRSLARSRPKHIQPSSQRKVGSKSHPHLSVVTATRTSNEH